MTGFGYNVNGFGADYTRVEYYEASVVLQLLMVTISTILLQGQDIYH